MRPTHFVGPKRKELSQRRQGAKQRGKEENPSLFSWLLCALASLREIFFLLKEIDVGEHLVLLNPGARLVESVADHGGIDRVGVHAGVEQQH
jgi:hypothetical protein